MSVILCGKRSPASFFEEEYLSPVPASKRVRCSTTVTHFSPPPAAVVPPLPAVDSRVEHLRSLFPEMDQELLERALEIVGNDLDLAINNLNNLRLESMGAEVNSSGSNRANVGIEDNIWPSHEANENHNGEEGVSQNQYAAACNLAISGFEWVELIVSEMSNASNMDDARARASRVLEGLEKLIVARASTEATESFLKENTMLKEQVEKLLQENHIWKRAFKTMHGQKEEFNRCSEELQQLKQMMSQRDEQLRKLQMENYELKLRLMREQQSSPIPGRFHPDVFG